MKVCTAPIRSRSSDFRGVCPAHLRDDGLQYRVVPGVALAVGSADQHAVPFLLRPGGAADQNAVNLFLPLNRRFFGEVPFGPFIEAVSQPFPQRRVLREGQHLFREAVHVPRLKQQARHPRLNQVGDPADTGGDGGLFLPRPLGQRVGEGLGQRGQRIHVDCAVEAVHVGHPSGKADAPLWTQLSRQPFQLGALFAVSRDEQTGRRDFGGYLREGPNECPDVFDRRQARRDAENDAARLCPEPRLFQHRFPAPCGRGFKEGDAVVYGKHGLRVKAPGNQQPRHRVGDGDVIGQPPEAN